MCVALVLTSSGFSQSGLIKFTTENVELTEGDTLSTEIIMNTGSSPISVFDVHAVFDPEYIEILSINNVQGTLFQFHEPGGNECSDATKTKHARPGRSHRYSMAGTAWYRT